MRNAMLRACTLLLLTLPLPAGAGSAPAVLDASPIPIARARVDANHDFIPDYLGQGVTVSGRVALVRSAGAEALEVAIQDASGGIFLFGLHAPAPVQRGDSVTVTGTVRQETGAEGILVQRLRVHPGARRLPEPVELELGAAPLESMEGRRVQLVARVLGKGSNAGGVFLVLGAPEREIRVFVWAGGAAAFHFDRFNVGDRLRVTGAVTQYDWNARPDGHYEIAVERPADVEEIGLTQREEHWLLGGAPVLFLVGLGWVSALRLQVRRRTSELTEAEERFRSIFQASLEAMMVHGEGWRILDANPAACRLFGRSLDELPGVPLVDLLSEGSRAALPPVQEVLARGAVELQASPRRSDGAQLDLEVHVTVVEYRSQRRLLATLHDVTAQRRAQAELLHSNETLRAVVDATPLAIVTLDTDHRVLAWNRAAELTFGWGQAQVVGTFSPIVPPEARVEAWELDAQALAGTCHEGIVVRRLRRDGEVRTLQLWTSPLRRADGSIGAAVGIYVDMTDRLNLEAQLNHAQKMEAVGRLAGGIAHDFNNLLTTVVGNAGLIGADPGDRAAVIESVEEIEQAAASAAALTRQLLAFSRKQVLENRVLALNEVVAETESMLRRVIGEDVELVTELATDLPPITADRAQLQQILLNLAVNARDAMPRGGRLLLRTESVRVEAQEPIRPGVCPGEYAGLLVADSGEGIPLELQDRIFEPFFTTKEVGKGTGLGLATVYGIVRQSGGFVWVESEPGRGATFRLLFPACAGTPRQAEAAAPSGDAARGEETVLLAEDEASVRTLVRSILERRGYVVLPAADGAEALRRAEAHAGHIDLLITDLVMPRLNGRELAEQLLMLRPGTRVLFISGYAMDMAAPDGLTPGTAFLHKPFSPPELAARVREVLDGAMPAIPPVTA